MADVDFNTLLTQEFHWPKAGDKAFTVDADWRENAYIDPLGRGRLVMMMIGYKMAADLMVGQALKDPSSRDALVFPIIFNYRHFIELSLKFIIATYGPEVGVEAQWQTHDLAKLWTEYLKVEDGYQIEDIDGATRAAGQVVAQFAKVDPRSFAYRYPVDTSGKAVELSEHHINLQALAVVMNSLDNYFSGVDGYLDHLQKAVPRDREDDIEYVGP